MTQTNLEAEEMRTGSIERVIFIASLAVLAWLYGFATSAQGWFPNDFLVRAWNQAEAVVGTNSVASWSSTRVYDRSGVRIYEPQAVSPGMTLVSGRWEESNWQPALRLIDAEGNAVHEWRISPADIFGDDSRIVHGFHLFPDGDVLVNSDYAGTVRLDACARVVWKLALSGHHSVHPTDDGSFWVAAMKEESAPHAFWQVDGPGPVYQDWLLHVSADGDVLERISVLDVLAASEATLPYLIIHQEGSDITHLNDVEPLESSIASEYPEFQAGDLLVSLKHLNLVMVIDAQSHQVKWHSSGPFIQQHDPDFIGNGWVGIFDNREDGTYRGTRLGGSRIVALQPHTDSLRVLFPTPHSDPFHTPNMGTWQNLPNGNLLLTESRAGRVVEVTPAGRTVWEWVIPPYDESTIPEVYQSARYDLSRRDLAEWPCSDVDLTNFRQESER